MSLTQTASPSEVAWTAISVLALIINVGLTWTAQRDYAALIRAGKNGSRKIAAHTAFVIQFLLTLPQLVGVLIGVLAMLTPPVHPEEALTLSNDVVVGGLLFSRAILVTLAVYTHIRRGVLLTYLDHAEQSAGQRRHTEAMTELTHNTEISIEARDGAQDAYKAANAANVKIAETNRVAGESADNLRHYMEKLEGERQGREGDRQASDDRADARSDRAQDRQDTRDDRRDERERRGT